MRLGNMEALAFKQKILTKLVGPFREGINPACNPGYRALNRRARMGSSS